MQAWAVVRGSAIRLSFLYRHVGPLRNIRRLNQVRVNSQTSSLIIFFNQNKSSPDFVGYLKPWWGKPGATSWPQGGLGREGNMADTKYWRGGKKKKSVLMWEITCTAVSGRSKHIAVGQQLKQVAKVQSKL